MSVDVDVVEADRMAERDQLAGALGRLDPGDPRDAEDVALGRIARRDRSGEWRRSAPDAA